MVVCLSGCCLALFFSHGGRADNHPQDGRIVFGLLGFRVFHFLLCDFVFVDLYCFVYLYFVFLRVRERER